MAQKTPNKFDKLVEKLFDEFSRIPNFSLTSTDEMGSKAFNTVVYRLAEIHAYKNLVCNHFIPATNKAIFDTKRDLQTSRYRGILRVADSDLQETLHDTIRLAYVGLFHKLESFVNDVAKLSNLIFKEAFETKGSVEKWAKEQLHFDIRDWQQFYTVRKINWISNCVKHADGFPTKTPKPRLFEFVDETQRLILTPQEFRGDCELLIQLYPLYLQLMFMFGQHKILLEKPLLKEDYEFSPEIYEEQLERRQRADTMITNIVVKLKGLSA